MNPERTLIADTSISGTLSETVAGGGSSFFSVCAERFAGGAKRSDVACI